MYIESYTQGNKREVVGFEMPVNLPDKPPIEQFQNYGLPIDDQVFRREDIPEECFHSPRELDKRTLDIITEEMWHKRQNGEWWLIGGDEVYITGTHWFFLNFWYAEIGDYPTFRYESVDFFQVWRMAELSNYCFGLDIIKARRLGDTEKTLCAGYEMVTRYRKSKMGMQNTKDTDAQKNFIRICEANKRMPVFFKPQYAGSEEPTNNLTFKLRGLTQKQREEGASQGKKVDSLESDISYAPCKYKEYDGQRLRFFHFDEFAKISSKVLNIVEQWGVIKFTLCLNGFSNIVGKGIFSSTVEKIKDGESVEVCTKLWEQSDPNKVDAIGLTMSGLWRYLRNYRLLAPVDKFGRHDFDAITRERDAQIESYVKSKDYTGLEAYLRKMPDDITDALRTSGEECPLYPTLLDTQSLAIRKGTVPGHVQAVRGSLVWNDKKFGDVSFIPGENGDILLSGAPPVTNRWSIRGGQRVPANDGWGCIGVDGFDHVHGVSDGAIAGYRNFNELEDDLVDWGENDDGDMVILNKEMMKTGRFFLSYRGRPSHPDLFYELCAKVCIFTGLKVYAERDKPGVLHYFQNNGLGGYLMFRPGIYRFGTKQKDPGEKATVTSINIWLGQITDHVYRYWQTYTHADILSDFRNFNGSNRTKCDLLVACGHAKMGAEQYDVINENKKRKQNNGRTLPVRTY